MWSPIWLCLWHFSLKLASAVCSVRFTSGDALLGKEEYSPLNLELFYGPLEGDHLLKRVMSIFRGLKIISLKLVLLDTLQIVWHSWIWKKWQIQDNHSPKSDEGTAVSFIQQHSFSWDYAVHVYWKSEGSSWLALTGCSPLQSFPLAVWQNFKPFKMLVLM